ncbi:hypothetical protein F1880_004493 [Penicillium rolfsii]|nr:hypothetical protein F1880_004493 [Penicillium rolfsii]
MAQPRPTPEPMISSRKSTIFDANASNPDFVPGYSVLRVEQAKHMTNSRDKTRLMNSIVDDIVATISSVTEYHQNGILSDDNIFQVSTMILYIGQTNLKMQDRLENKISRLKRRNFQQRQDYVELTTKMDYMGQTYAAKVEWLKEQVKVLKDRIARVEAQGSRSQSQKDFGERCNRYLEEVAMNRGFDDQQQMVQDKDNADVECEEDEI